MEINQAMVDEAERKMKELVDLTNAMIDEDAVIEGMARGLMHSHRTLQQNFFRAFRASLETYSEGGSDLRNQASIDWAKKAVKIEQHIPFI